ncbi:hypothetical protein DUNSADRAFT_11933 [Dunaliella salina]|uniref:Protein SirB1 N-terminal domain-containing protein n=1 Tax=Dunaliella salina TaxID=3046 RepID=A0ABQ7GCC7_DUNSA|nr:hypothetical protein DUNSADRAFT_11933 [Dunaliella salina]|eukprot:KAF5832261.1 hypothetical protein DUNSADRAFT_11933 [Dunaliella salina]
MEVWPTRTKQWHFSKSSWTTLEREGQHLRLFAERWQVDKEALRSLESMVSPEKREEALTKLRAFGSDCLDVLLAAAHLYKGGPKDGLHLHQALMAVQAVRTAAELRSLLDRDTFDLAHLEHGALCIAQAHAPHLDVFGFVTPYLDRLAAEALARIAAMDGNPTNRQALEVVNQLLFLPRHEDQPFPFTVAAPLFLANVNHEAAWGDYTHRLNSIPLPPPSPNMWAIPPPGCGLELRGNAGDYYCAANSLLHDILGRSGMGIPISLCIIHAAVCQRIGIPVHLLRMPMVCLRKEKGRHGHPHFVVHHPCSSLPAHRHPCAPAPHAHGASTKRKGAAWASPFPCASSMRQSARASPSLCTCSACPCCV